MATAVTPFLLFAGLHFNEKKYIDEAVFQTLGMYDILMTTEVCRIGGVIVPMALAGNPVEFILGRVSFKEQTVVGSRVYTHEHFSEGVKLLADISKKLELDPLVSDILPLYEANRAIEMMRNGTNAGKILIDCENK